MGITDIMGTVYKITVRDQVVTICFDCDSLSTLIGCVDDDDGPLHT